MHDTQESAAASSTSRGLYLNAFIKNPSLEVILYFDNYNTKARYNKEKVVKINIKNSAQVKALILLLAMNQPDALACAESIVFSGGDLGRSRLRLYAGASV